MESEGSVGSEQIDCITWPNLHPVQSFNQCKFCVILHTDLSGVLWLTVCVVGGVLWQGATGVTGGYAVVHVAEKLHSGGLNVGKVALQWVKCRKSCTTLLGQIFNSAKVQVTGVLRKVPIQEGRRFATFPTTMKRVVLM